MAHGARLEELSEQITVFFRALESRRTHNAETVGLTPTEYRALARVVEIGQKTPKNLAMSMGMSTGAITAVTDSLVARGLLERIANPDDRRSIMLVPTVEGRATIDLTFGAYRRIIGESIGDASDDCIAELISLLDRITQGLQAR